MSLIFAASLLAMAAPPPSDDDDAKPQRAPSDVTAPKTNDVDEAKAGPSPAAGRSPDDDDEEGRTKPNSVIVVTARRLDAARTQIDAGLGATVYSLTNDTIENRPGGETGSISDILGQAPGVTVSGATINVRGSRANQVRINNVIIPEAISDPADLLSSRLAETTHLITGTLPAQFGFAPAGVISITTKNGLYQHGGQAELFAGDDGTIEPAFEWAGSAESASLFASGELEHDHSTVSDMNGNSTRDRRKGIDGLGFADHVIDDENRISLVVGGSREHHRFGKTSIGPGIETNGDAFGVATYQHTRGAFTLQSSLFAGVASDEAQFSAATRERSSSWGTQIDGTDAISAAQTLRFGLLATHSTVHELDLAGDRQAGSRTSVALYAQDEWKLTSSLTFNPGTRMEWSRGFGSLARVEPRASLVWERPEGLSAHVGYARYVSAPPLGENSLASNFPDERDDYWDAGAEQKLGSVTVGIDGYWRRAHNYIAEHETPGTAVPAAFEFKRARIGGVELSATYAHGGSTAWMNLAFARAQARTIVGGEAIFEAETIAAASDRFVPLASDRPVTVSGGFTHRVGKFSLGGDVLVSSGAVRTLDFANPNAKRHSPYAVVGVAAVYHAKIAGQPADLRLDLTNLTNVHYATSDASNLEGGWTRWGRGRAITIGIEQGF